MLAASLLAVLSYLSFPLFIHTYCENRPIMLILAVLGVAQFISLYDSGRAHRSAE